MSFLEKHQNPEAFPTKTTHLDCMANYFSKNGLRLANVIGEGSYSKVRLCNVKNADGSEQTIACKVISKRKASDDFVNKFLPRELEIVGRLRNPNIVTIFDVVEFDNHVFIFMDYCSKGDLLEFVKRKGFLSEKRSQHYFWQILSAVRYLHGLDLAHRDLKCENVLLCSNDVVKISDFGFSRYCHDINRKRILSSTYCGSAAYAAPEILQGTMYNPKLYDMWSLGCILFIMLTGHMPYDEGNIHQMLQNQADRILNYPHQLEGLISKSAKCLIRHLLEPDVTRRATIEHAISNDWFSSMIPKTTMIPKPSSSSVNVAGGSGDYKGVGQRSPPQIQPMSSRGAPRETIINESPNDACTQDVLKIPSRSIRTYACNEQGRNPVGAHQCSSKKPLPISPVWRNFKASNSTPKQGVAECPEIRRKGPDKPKASYLKSSQKPGSHSHVRFHDENLARKSDQKFQPSKHKFL